jgi:hypothetical protein
MSYHKGRGQLNRPIPEGPIPEGPIPQECEDKQEEPEAMMISAKLVAHNEDVAKTGATISQLGNQEFKAELTTRAREENHFIIRRLYDQDLRQSSISLSQVGPFIQ